MKNALIAWLVLLFVSFGSRCVAAEENANWENAECQWYLQGGTETPPGVDQILRLKDGGAAKVCYFAANKLQAYFAVGAPRRGPAGACQYSLDQVYRSGRKWVFLPPKRSPYPPVHEIYMSGYEGACPKANDASYVLTNGTSEGVFLAFLRFWTAAAASLETFDSATDQQAKASNAYQELRKLIGDGRLTLRSIGLANHLGDLGGVSFDAQVSNPEMPQDVWIITVDLASSGFRVLHVLHGIQ